MKNKIFISYSSEDSQIADEISKLLNGFNFNCFYDKQLDGGTQWWDEILKQIQECNAFIFLFSEKSIASEACLKEIKFANILNRNLCALSIDGSNAVLLPKVFTSKQLINWDNSAQAGLDISKYLSNTKWNELPNPIPTKPKAPPSYLLNDILHDINNDLVKEKQDEIVHKLLENLQIPKHRKSTIIISQKLRIKPWLTQKNKAIIDSYLVGQPIESIINSVEKWAKNDGFEVRRSSGPNKIILKKGRISTPANIELYFFEEEGQLAYTMSKRIFDDLAGFIMGNFINIYLLGFPLRRATKKIMKNVQQMVQKINNGIIEI